MEQENIIQQLDMFIRLITVTASEAAADVADMERGGAATAAAQGRGNCVIGDLRKICNNIRTAD